MGVWGSLIKELGKSISIGLALSLGSVIVALLAALIIYPVYGTIPTFVAFVIVLLVAEKLLFKRVRITLEREKFLASFKIIDGSQFTVTQVFSRPFTKDLICTDGVRNLSVYAVVYPWGTIIFLGEELFREIYSMYFPEGWSSRSNTTRVVTIQGKNAIDLLLHPISSDKMELTNQEGDLIATVEIYRHFVGEDCDIKVYLHPKLWDLIFS